MKNLLLHLRLNLSLVLAPIFLWGYFLSGEKSGAQFIIAFAAYHIFLYGGSNAYNSYYDKDEGPIGGLYNPPPVTKQLLYFSLLNKFAGLLISFFINLPFFLTYLLFFILSVIYSHPSTRWKANPYLSILTIGIGQGGIAFAAGWFSATGTIADFSLFIPGMMTTIFMSMGIYPLTQLYQIEEDKRKNDITFAVYWGVTNSFKFSVICAVLSALSMLTVIYLLEKYLELILITGFYLIFVIKVFSWSKDFKEQEILKNYGKIMKLNYMNGLGFSCYIIISMIFS